MEDHFKDWGKRIDEANRLLSIQQEARAKEKLYFEGDLSSVCEIVMGEFAIAAQDFSHPVLATWGIAPCLGILGYSEAGKFGILGHLPPTFKLEGVIPKMLEEIPRNILFEKFAFYLFSNEQYRLDKGQEILDFYRTRKSYLGLRRNYNITNIEKKFGCDQSVAIDVRTGKQFNYEPKGNPNSKLWGIRTGKYKMPDFLTKLNNN